MKLLLALCGLASSKYQDIFLGSPIQLNDRFGWRNYRREARPAETLSIIGPKILVPLEAIWISHELGNQKNCSRDAESGKDRLYTADTYISSFTIVFLLSLVTWRMICYILCKKLTTSEPIGEKSIKRNCKDFLSTNVKAERKKCG